MKVGILFGGRSYEREISVITAAEVAAALKGRAEVYPIYAEKGEFYLLKGDFTVESFLRKNPRKKKLLFTRKEGRGAIKSGGRKIPLDCVVMCCHGGEGEDGAFSALMEIYDIPYTAPSPVASAVTMDKRITKLVAEKMGFPTPKSVWGRRGEDLPERAKALTYPMIVKPARLGSSIGIAVAHDEKELIEGIGAAFAFDRDVIVEEMIRNPLELNCAAFSEKGEIVVGGVETPQSWHEYLTFEEKYEGRKGKGGSRLLRGALAEQVKAVTKEIYRAFELFGIVRVDYLYDKEADILYLNEINAQPGSLAFYLFEEIGVDFVSLLERVIAESSRRAQERDIISFNSGVLENLSVSVHK